MASFTGTTGDDRFGGTIDGDNYDIGQGGEDTVLSGDGDDVIFAGGTLDADDRIDGGSGSDTLVLQGDYSAGLAFGKTMMRNIEILQLNGGFDYDLTLSDANLTGLSQLNINAYGEHGDRLDLDLSALASGHDTVITVQDEVATITGGAGNDTMLAFGSGKVTFDGGDGSDALVLYRPMTRADHFSGGDADDTASDQLNLAAGTSIRFSAEMMSHSRQLGLSGGYFDITLVDANLAAGETLTVFANNTVAGESVRFDGHAERDGHYEYLGGVEADTVIGGQSSDTVQGFDGDDLITGGRGADNLTGGEGNDHFVYLATSPSTRKYVLVNRVSKEQGLL